MNKHINKQNNSKVLPPPQRESLDRGKQTTGTGSCLRWRLRRLSHRRLFWVGRWRVSWSLERGRCNSENAGQGSFRGEWHQYHVPWQKGARALRMDWMRGARALWIARWEARRLRIDWPIAVWDSSRGKEWYASLKFPNYYSCYKWYKKDHCSRSMEMEETVGSWLIVLQGRVAWTC